MNETFVEPTYLESIIDPKVTFKPWELASESALFTLASEITMAMPDHQWDRGSEEGLHLRLKDFCITQLQARE